ncbi:MAG: iron permease [Hyphomicrobiales bacterium]|nr:iron permease [Hyphomicrobiales bacterium]
MLASFLICLRESLELGFVVALCFAVLDPVSPKRRWIVGGVAVGFALALAFAAAVIVLHAAWAEQGEDLLGATLLILATGSLLLFRAWRVRYGEAFVLGLHRRGKASVQDGKLLGSMAIVIAAAVFREGSETILFLYGVVASTKDTLLCVMLGLVLGVSVGLSAIYVIYHSIAALPIRPVMQAANLVLILFSAGMAARSVEILQDLNIVSSTVIWSTKAIVSQESLFGHMLQCIIGYSDEPTFFQLAAYLVVLIMQFGISLIPKQRPAGLEKYRATLKNASERP